MLHQQNDFNNAGFCTLEVSGSQPPASAGNAMVNVAPPA